MGDNVFFALTRPTSALERVALPIILNGDFEIDSAYPEKAKNVDGHAAVTTEKLAGWQSSGTVNIINYSIVTAWGSDMSANFNQCATEHQQCTCEDGHVRYGYSSQNKWSTWRYVEDTIECENSVFTDPAPRLGKAC